MINSLIKAVFILFVGLLIIKDGTAKSSNLSKSSISDQSSITIKPPNEVSDQSFEKRIHAFRKSTEELSSLFENASETQISDKECLNIVNLIPIFLNGTKHFKKDLGKFEKLGALNEGEKSAVDSLKSGFTEFKKQLNDKIKSCDGLLTKLRDDFARLKKKAPRKQFPDCANYVKGRKFNLAWKALKLVDDATIHHLVEKVYNKCRDNFDLVLQFAEKGSDPYKIWIIYKTLRNEMTIVGDNDPSRLIALIGQLETKVIPRQDITVASRNEAEELSAELQPLVVKNFTETSTENILKYAKQIQKLFRENENLKIHKLAYKSQLEVIKDKFPNSVKAIIFEAPLVRVRNVKNKGYLSAADGPLYGEKHATAYVNTFHRAPRHKKRLNWKIKRFPNGMYSIVNLLYDKILFSNEEQYSGKFNESRRYACTAGERCLNTTADGFWEFQFDADRYAILKNARYNEYLSTDGYKRYSSVYYCVFTLMPGELTEGSKWEIIECS